MSAAGVNNCRGELLYRGEPIGTLGWTTVLIEVSQLNSFISSFNLRTIFAVAFAALAFFTSAITSIFSLVIAAYLAVGQSQIGACVDLMIQELKSKLTNSDGLPTVRGGDSVFWLLRRPVVIT